MQPSVQCMAFDTCVEAERRMSQPDRCKMPMTRMWEAPWLTLNLGLACHGPWSIPWRADSFTSPLLGA